MNNYFSHDSNARNDEKLIRLRMKHKAAGYGVYFMILERMRDEKDYMCARDYGMIAFDLREDAELIKSVVEDFDLFSFTEDGAYFYSPSFMNRMESKDEKQKAKSEARSAAGKKGMANRWGRITNDNKTENTDNKIITKEEDVITNNNIIKEMEDTIDSEKMHLLMDIPWVESICMRYHIKTDVVAKDLDLFFLDCRARGKLRHNNLMDAKSHFADWLRINLKQQKKNGNNSHSTTTKEQRADEYAKRISQLIAEDRAEAMEDN